MLGLVVGVAVFMAALAYAVHALCQRYPVVQAVQRAPAAPDHPLLAPTRAIAAQSFAKLATHADLPRFRLRVADAHFEEDDARVRVQAFLDAVFGLANGTSCREHGIDLPAVPRPDIVGDQLHVMLVALEQAAGSPRGALGVLKCATQSVVAPFIVKGKLATQKFPFNSEPYTWRCSVAVANAEELVVCHRKTERGRDPHAYVFTWSVSFHVHRVTGTLLRVRPLVEQLDVQAVEPAVRQQVADTVHAMFA